MTIKNYVQVGGVKYAYSIAPVDTWVSRITCKEARVDQEFLNEDIVAVLSDIPNLIQAERKHSAKQDSVIRFRVSSSEKLKIQNKAKQKGYTTMSDFIKDSILD